MGGETASGRDAGSICPSTVEQSKKRRLNFVKALMIGQLLSLAMATTGLTSGYLATKQGVSIPNTQSLLNYLLLAAVWGTIVQLQTRPGWPSLLLWRSSQSRRSAGVDATVATGDGTVGKLEEGIVNAARCGTLLPLRHEPASTNGNRGDTSRLAWARDEREEGRRPASHVRHDLRNGHHAAGDGEHETRHSASRYRAATTFDASPVPEEAEGEEEGEEEVLQVRLGVSNGLSKEREGEWIGSLTTEAESGNTRGGRSWTWRGGRLMVFPLLGLFDVEANFIIVMAYRFTSVTSVSLLDCFTIPLVMLGSTVFLHAQYRRHHVLGCLICVAGLATILLTDHWSRGDSASSAPLLGDAMVLLAATLYSVGNVTQEKLLGSCVPTSFLLAQLGMWGSLFCSIQVFTLERHRLAEVELGSVPVWGPMVGFSVALFSFSSLVPYVLSNAGSAALNLSLLTSDLWVTMFRILFFGGFTTLELIGFAASLLQVTGGLVLFSIGGDPYSCQHRAADAAPQATAGGAGRPATAGEGDEVPLIGPADSWPSHISHIELSSPVVSTQASEQALVMDHAESPLPGSWSDSPRAMLCPDVNRQPRPL